MKQTSRNATEFFVISATQKMFEIVRVPDAFQSSGFISWKVVRRKSSRRWSCAGWHWRSRPIDSVGNVANVVTECHRAPSRGIGTPGREAMAAAGENDERGTPGDISSLGTTKVEREGLMSRGRAGYLLPVGATSCHSPPKRRVALAFCKNDKFLSLTTLPRTSLASTVSLFYASREISRPLL